MNRTFDADVAIVGSGPVGMTLGIDLASRGVNCIIVEMRDAGEPPSVKCNHVSARSMEILRRLGVAHKLRNVGLPADYANDVSYRISFTGRELSRIPIPCRRDRYTAKDGPDTWWPTAEPPHRVNQIYIEPVLFAHARDVAGIRFLNRTRVDSFTQDEAGVEVVATSLDDGSEIRIRAAFMVGCDGGKSSTRKAIGATLSGTAVVQRVQSTYIHAPDLLGRSELTPAWATFSLNPVRSGNVYAIDGRERWLVHNYLKPDEEEFDAVDRDWALKTILGVPDDFQYEIISKEDWIGRRLVADKLRQDRVFICGDAAHLWVPMAGYGMNAGIADAANLAWLLAAHVKSWAPYGILAAHEAERLPITEQVSHFAMNHAIALSKQRSAVPSNIDDDTDEGRQARASMGQQAYDLNVQQYCCAGLNFGYFYDKSPIIAYDGAVQPGYGMATFTSSTVPGCRTPHIWLDDGRSLYDALGPGYTLLRLDDGIDVTALLEAAFKRKIPFDLLDIRSADAKEVYDHALVLARPDQHNAWRGNRLPEDVEGLLDLISGRMMATA